MSVAEANRLKFVEQFNRVLGTKAGHPMAFQSDAVINHLVDEKHKTEAAIQLAKKLKVTASKKSTTKKKTDVPGATTAAELQALLSKNSGGGTPKLSGGFSDAGNAQIDLKKSSGGPTGGLSGIWKGIDEAITNNPVTDAIQDNPVTRFSAHALPKALDYVARPGYAVAEGINRASEVTDFGSDKSMWSLPAEFFHGAVAGATGKKRTGFGEITDNAPVLAEYVDAMEKKHPEAVTPELKAMRDSLMEKYNDKTGIEQWSHRIAGGAGDILTDPTTYFTGGTEVVAKGAAEAGGRILGKEAARGTLDVGKEALKSQTTRIVKKIVDDHKLSNVKKPRPGSTINKTLVDHISDQVHAKLDDVVYDMRKGGMIGSSKDYGTIAHSISESVRDSFLDIVRKPAEKYASNLRLGKKFTNAERAALKANNPLFSDWLDVAEKIAKTGKHGPDEIFRLTQEQFVKKLEPHIQSIYATAKGELDDALLRVPTMEWMGKKIYLPKLGKAAKFAGEKALANPHIANLNKAWRYSSWFPGYTTHISQKLKSMNVQRYDGFKDEIETLLQDTTKAQRVNIHRAIQERIQLPGIDGDIQKEIQRHYKEMYYEELGRGARTKNATPFVDNYVYNPITKGGKADPDFYKEWKGPKKEQAKLHKNIDGFTSLDAVKKGYRAEEDVGQALLARKAKSIRELSRINFKRDLVDHYGIKSSMHPRLAAKAGMVPVDEKKFAELYKKAKLKPGEKLYLDEAIEDVYNNYNELVKYGKNARADSAALALDNVTKLFKTANTIYWPGFHIRNAASDIIMGIFDGVKSHRYGQVMSAMTHKDTAKLAVGGIKTDFRKIYNSYLDNAATAGFFDSEMKHTFDPRDLSTAKYMDQTLKGGIKKVNNKLRDLSQGREDFGRLVHYYHALDDEMTHQLKKGLKPDVAWKNAEEAAIERVNKFKFDYNALTPNEQRMRRFGMPFYTYMRKATPVLLENLMMQPKYFSRMKRMQDSLAPSEEFRGSSVPGWMQEMAYSELSSGSHIGMTDALLPTRTLKETFSNPASRMNPVLQGIYEYASGKDTFSGKPVSKGVDGITDILKNKMRAVSTWRSIESDTKPTIDKWAGFFGIPLVQVSEARQDQRLRELEDQVTQKSTALNQKLDDEGLKIRITGGKIYLVQPKSPTADELAHNMKPRYPENPKEKILGVYTTFNELPFKF